MKRNLIESLTNFGICIGIIESLSIVQDLNECKHLTSRLSYYYNSISNKIVKSNFNIFLIRWSQHKTYNKLENYIYKLIKEEKLDDVRECFRRLWSGINRDRKGGCLFDNLICYFVENQKNVKKRIMDDLHELKRDFNTHYILL